MRCITPETVQKKSIRTWLKLAYALAWFILVWSGLVDADSVCSSVAWSVCLSVCLFVRLCRSGVVWSGLFEGRR